MHRECLQAHLAQYLASNGNSANVCWTKKGMSNFFLKKFSSIPVLLVQLAPITEPRKSIKINLSHCRLAVHWDYPQGQGKVTSSVQARQSLQRPRHWIVCLSLWRCFSFSSGNTFLKGFPTQALWLSKGPILFLPKGWWRVSCKVGKEEWVLVKLLSPACPELGNIFKSVSFGITNSSLKQSPAGGT